VTYKLSYRDLTEMMAERHLDAAHTTIMRWVQRYRPEFVTRWQHYARSVGASWRVDQPSIKGKGPWLSLYRGGDKEGQTIDFFLRERRDMPAAQRCLPQAVEKRGVPGKTSPEG
jgi:transposase-like protein